VPRKKRDRGPPASPEPGRNLEQRIVLLVAAWVGASTLAYEVLWSRVLRYFVDTSLQSFAIVLAAFLCGIAAGSVLASRLADSSARFRPGSGEAGDLPSRFRPGSGEAGDLPSRDLRVLVGAIEVGAGVASVLCLEVVAHTTAFVTALESNLHLGKSFGGQAAARFLAFSVALLLPTALLGGAFPLLARAAKGSGTAPLGRVYGLHTAGGVVGSLAAGFALLPSLGVQKSVVLVSGLNVAAGIGVLLCSRLAQTTRVRAAAASAVAFLASWAVVRPNAILSVYTERYAPPGHELLYLDENVSSTTAVFRKTSTAAASPNEGGGRAVPGGQESRYLVIDGRGEVSTDYYSIRAFRLLALLPVFYVPRATSALVVTFGSGIVAGSIASVPEVKDEDCVEICADAFQAARYFSAENHDVLGNPKVHRLVGDGRNHVLTTRKQYDVLSADATHPRSGDSWVLYTREFYELCAARLTDGGVMSQWVPMHGLTDGELRSILKTFHAAFPFVAVHYGGGFKGGGHLVLLGSKRPLRIDIPRAEALFLSDTVRADLADVNVLALPDLFAGFLFDETAVDAFVGGAPLNTDDKPVVAFGESNPSDATASPSTLAALASHRQPVFPHLSNIAPESAQGIEGGLATAFDATGHALEGQVIEAQEYAARAELDLDHPDESTREGLARSRALLERAMKEYLAALRSNPRDAHTRYLLMHLAAEAQSLEALSP
jgi:spermidine synthase